jgi:hypothetical protein
MGSAAREAQKALAVTPVQPAPKPSAPSPPPTDAPDWERFRREAAQRGPGIYGCVLRLDETLIAHGFHALSPWWRAKLREWEASGKPWGVFMVGRGGAKSVSLVRLAVALGLFSQRTIPPGQQWICPFISVSSGDASRRIREIASILQAIGIAAEPTGPTTARQIEVNDARGQPIAFVSMAGTIANVSGPNTCLAMLDEEAKMRDRVTNANPASEIIASLAQTSRGRPEFRAIRCSSAWTDLGSHAQAIAEGDTAEVFVARIGAEFLSIVTAGLEDVAQWESDRGDVAAAERIRKHAAGLTAQSPCVPTWLGNPSISALASRRLAEVVPPGSLEAPSRAEYWLRENASVAMPAVRGIMGATNTVENFNAITEEVSKFARTQRDTATLDGGGVSSAGLKTAPGLSRYDQRSEDYRGPVSGTGGRTL